MAAPSRARLGVGHTGWSHVEAATGPAENYRHTVRALVARNLRLVAYSGDRCITVKDVAFIPIFGPTGLARQLGMVEYSRSRRLRASWKNGWIEFVR